MNSIEATVRIFDRALRETLRRLGSITTVDQVLAAACREQRRFFDALDAITQRTARARAAWWYLVELGIVPATQAMRPAHAAPPYYFFKIVGAGAALCIAEAQTRTTKQYTVKIEGAVALAVWIVRLV